jgi:hypothetical protein
MEELRIFDLGVSENLTIRITKTLIGVNFFYKIFFAGSFPA